MPRTANIDRAGLLLALRDTQQQVALATLALGSRDFTRADCHLRNAQRLLLPAVAVAQSDPDDADD